MREPVAFPVVKGSSGPDAKYYAYQWYDKCRGRYCWSAFRGTEAEFREHCRAAGVKLAGIGRR